MSIVAPNRFSWLKSGLFWRTFILMAVLITVSMAAWVASFRMLERTPRARQLAAQVISIVTITRSALTHSAPESRRELLFDLASNEGIRIYTLEASDRVEPVTDSSIMSLLQETVITKLGSDTKFAGKVNGIPGFWVSFRITDDAEDEYWLMLDQDRLVRKSSIQFLRWATITLLLALLGAVFISRLINLPLARLTAAARSIAKGEALEPLPEQGPAEIKEANRSFNHMAADLAQVESDRAVILAGISHDLRTPISRMLLEVEMANLTEEARSGMQSDLAQMDAIIGQFLDYARPTDPASFSRIDLTTLLHQIAQDAFRLQDIKITSDIAPDLVVMGHATDLKRVINNLIENARRYGKLPDAEHAELYINCHIEQKLIVLEISDHGTGVPDAEIDRLLRPFARLDTARSQADGAGLGLAIVARIIQRHAGQLRLHNRVGGGLIITITLPRQ